MDTRSGDTFEAKEEQLRDLLSGKPAMTGATAAKVGFRELSATEAQDVRDCRELGAHCERILNQLARNGADGRWAAVAKTHFQEGLMAAVRAVTKPAFF